MRSVKVKGIKRTLVALVAIFLFTVPNTNRSFAVDVNNWNDFQSNVVNTNEMSDDVISEFQTSSSKSLSSRLEDALNDDHVTNIVLTNKITITASDTLRVLDFKGKTLTLQSGDKALEFSNVGDEVTVSNVTINQSGTTMKYGIHAYLTDIVLNNVTVTEPRFAGILVNGSKLTANGYTYVPSNNSYAAVELAMGNNVTVKPSIDETSTISGGPVYADVNQINTNPNLTDEEKAAIISDIKQNLINVAKKNGITAFTNENGNTQLPIPQDPTPEKPTYRPSSPSKDLPSNTKECQKEFGDEYIWSDEYDACVIKFMIPDTATR